MNNTTTTAERGSNFSTPFPIRDTDFVEQFRAAMLDHGLDVASAAIVPDGKEHRYDADSDRKGTKNGWGALHIEGDQAWGGFGDWKRGTSIPWSAKGAKAPSKSQRKAMDARIAAAKAADKVEREAAYAAAAERAREVFDAASPANPVIHI
jgi:putative DNA primase/helicase